ncbi:MAG: sensor histidine kinase, partial [Bryobacteraceae bacterium]
LLQLAQAETGQIRLNRQPEMLAEVAARQLAQFRPLAEKKRIELRLDAPDACIASVDRLQIERLIGNLLSNAIQYTQEGGRVEVRLRQEGEEAVLEVADNGPGIPEQHLPHIFEKFYRVREGERTAGRGVGLGLAFVQWIAGAHGGSVRVRSRVGEGTTFEVRIPSGAEPAPVEDAAAR